MSERVSDQIIRLDVESWRTLNKTVRRLESAWQAGRPELGEFIPDDSGPLRTSTLIQLIKVDQELSWESGERRVLESYLSDWPELAADTDALTELLEAECLNRALADAPPDGAELKDRFPEIADRIDLQTIADQAAADGSRSRRSDDSSADESDRAGHPEPPSGTDSATGLLPGNRFGRYEIRQRIGHGSMGAVYLAWDTRLRREVALKIPHFDRTADVELIEQFRSEAVAMAQVHHPAVCPVFDAFEVDGTFALTMARVDGQHLGDWIAHRRIDQQQAAELVLALTRGVDAIHERGVIHRDIKPANVVVNRRGEPVLTDFGLAQRLDGTQTPRDGERLSGTPAYMAPEQIDGEVAADPRSDVYSLGVLLFQMLTGDLPFSGDLKTVLDAVRHQPPPKPSSLRPGLNRTLELICLKALEKQPDDRFGSAEAMAQSLESCVGSLRQRRHKQRRRLVAAVGTTLIAIVAVLAVYLQEPPKSDEDLMLLARPVAELRIPGSDSSHRAIVPVDDSRLLVASRHGGYAPFRFFDTDTQEDGRPLHFAIPNRFYSDPGRPRHDHMGAVLSRDGRYLFCNDYYANCLIRIDQVSTDQNTRVDFLPISHHWARTLSLSPDGTRLVAATGQSGRPGEGSDNALVIVDVADGAFEKLAEVHLTDHAEMPENRAISEEIVGTRFGFRDGSESVFALTGKFRGTEPRLVEVSLRAPYAVINRATFSGTRLHDLVVSDNHEQILVSDEVSRTVRVLDLDSLTDTGREYSVYGHVPGPLALSPDERTLFVLSPESRRLVCLDSATGEVIGGAQGLPGAGQRLLFAPDGSTIWSVHPESVVAQFDVDDLLHRIVFASNPEGTHQIHAMTFGGSVLKLSEGPHSERCPRWSPDGRRIAFISNRAGSDHILVMNRAGDHVRVFEETDPVIGEQHEVPLDWSPDGTQIAFVGGNHKAIRVVDVETGDVQALLDSPAVPQAGRVYDHHNGLSWSRTENAIVFNSQVESYGHDQDVLRLNPETGDVTAITDLWGKPKYVVGPSAARAGRRIAAISIDPGPPTAWQVCEWTGTSVRLAGESQEEELRNPRWLPNEKRVLFSAGPPGSARLFVLPVKGGDSKLLRTAGPDNIDADIWSAR